ncbi:uncharacterized protein LOC135489301 [Lineus longissimus]|uniref:uncharacterized protein LOC135489301 n=1 Tax=Lineus longissimus TaxID=88925 RepID=UPI00315CD7EC
MSQQTKVRFGHPVVTSSMGACYTLPSRGEFQKKKRRERHPAGDSSVSHVSQNGAKSITTPEIPPFSRSSSVCDRPSPVREVPSPVSSCRDSPVNSAAASPILPRLPENLRRPSPEDKSDQRLPTLDSPSPARESNRPSPAGSIPTIPEEEEPNSQAGSFSSNRRRRHSSGQRVVRRTRTRHHRPVFASRKVDVLGQMQIMCAVLIIIVELLLVTKFPLPDHFPGIGFVAGLCFLVSGGLGILSSCTQKHAQILLCMMTAIIAMVVAAFVAVFATLGFMESLSYQGYGDDGDDHEVLNQLFYMLQAIICSIEIIGALGQATICCCATCCLDCKCRRRATEITVIYATCPTTGSLDDIKKPEESAGEKEMHDFVDRIKDEKDFDDKNNKDEGIENDESTSGCETMMDDEDVLKSNEELNEFWVIPRVVRGGQRARSDSSSSKKRERQPSGNSGKHRHFSDSSVKSEKRDRNFSGSSAKSEKRRHSSSSKMYDKKERHDSGYPETPVDSIAPTFDRTTILDPMVLVNYGSGDTIVRNERGSESSVRGSQQTVCSERNSDASNRCLEQADPSAQNLPGCSAHSVQQCRSNSQDEDSVFVDVEYVPQNTVRTTVVMDDSFTNSNSCFGDSRNDMLLGASRDDSQTRDITLFESSLRRVRAEENLQRDSSVQNCRGPSRQDSNMSNVSDCLSALGLQLSSLQTSEEDTSESSGIKSMSRESSLEYTS